MNANNPIGSGFIASIARPGGNITGFVAFEPDMGGKWLETLREICHPASRVLASFITRRLYYRSAFSVYRAYLTVTGHPEDSAFAVSRCRWDRTGNSSDYALKSNGGLLVCPDNFYQLASRDLIVRLAARHRLPAIYPFRQFMAAGGIGVLRR